MYLHEMIMTSIKTIFKHCWIKIISEITPLNRVGRVSLSIPPVERDREGDQMIGQVQGFGINH